MKRQLRIINFKQYNEKEFILDGQLLAFIGCNGSGKSSAIQALETILQLKGFVKEPIRTGENSANIGYKGNDLSGNPITITCNIEKDNIYSFNATTIKDNKIKTISDVKKIRELIGTYYPLSVEEVFSMVKYAEGRRKFIDDYLYTLIDPVLKKELINCQLQVSDKKNKDTENNLFYTRAKEKKSLELLSAEISAMILTDTEKEDLKLKPQIIKLINELKEEYELHKDDTVKRKEFEGEINELNNIFHDLDKCSVILSNKYFIDTLKSFTDIYAKMAQITSKHNKDLKLLYTSEQLSALNTRIQNGSKRLGEIEAIEKKQEPKEKITRQNELFKNIETLEITIQKNRNRIKEIHSMSKFPAGLEINEDTIILNGFVLDETTNSNTECKLAILDLLCNISTSQYVCVGDWSLFDSGSRKKVLELAKKHERIFIGQEVTDQEETTLKTLIIN